MDMYAYYMGKSFDIYKYLGAHVEDNGTVFRTYAPAAESVSLIGDFSDWNEIPMNKIHDGNFYEIEVPNAVEGMMYKYRIHTKENGAVDHSDPYGYGTELRPKNASIIRNISDYEFHDEMWMKNRTDCKSTPLNIYELHLGSWKTNNENQWLSYEEIGEQLIPYLLEYNYNYIEVMPLNEYPADESWGYQSLGFYSPTSRYGDAKGLMKLIDMCHQNNIGVILDFIPVHFAVDGHGLAEFDGTALYEYPHMDIGYNEWGSKNFNHSRGEVRSFLQSAANYWLSEYHFDGLRMDAISNMIYWQGNPERGVNVNAVDFIKNMNHELKCRYPSVILSAEDSTAFPNVTKSVKEGGLGFDYKWDMGWMNDTLAYFKEGPNDRKKDYHKLTFSMMYFYSERFLMPFSHDEVVHGKATIMQKMNGQYEEKFPQARALYMYMYTHPGKKLNFMGNEFGQLREWDEKREQDWDMLKYPTHDSFHRFIKTLNDIYLKHPALYEKDFQQEGFQWLDCHQENRCIYTFVRKTDTEKILVVFNFSDTLQENYTVKLEGVKGLELLLDSDDMDFGGTGTKDTDYEYDNGALKMNIEAFSGRMYLLS